MTVSTHGTDWILGLSWDDVPTDVRSRVGLLIRDLAAVCAAGRATDTARIAAEYASAQHPGDEATSLLDGRRLSATGAAWANGVLANALDFDDGHRIAKGHPGANVIPAALAAAESRGASREELLRAIAVGYEVALRAGVALHERSAEYHASGAWGAVGAAAAAARLLELDGAQTSYALGLAEYHAPISPIMRSVAEPAMTKDACGIGASLGVSSALLAECGFTALASSLLSADTVSDLGERWQILDVYVKKFPCCRWSHPAIEAALLLRGDVDCEPGQVVGVRIDTFAAAAALARRHPVTTEEAQYSLAWPVGAALAHGSFAVEQVFPRAFDDPAIRHLASLIEIYVDPLLEAEFPARRRSRVTLELADGAIRSSPLTEAPGEPDDPALETIVAEKLKGHADGLDSAGPAGDKLLSQLASNHERGSLFKRVDRSVQTDGGQSPPA